MIELDLEPYCQEGCMRFEPNVVRTSYEDFAIRCEHGPACKFMLHYLKKRMEENNDNNP